jgi:hypothetical protein
MAAGGIFSAIPESDKSGSLLPVTPEGSVRAKKWKSLPCARRMCPAGE